MKTLGKLTPGSRESAPVARVWGLTGGAASGKSEATKFFEELGVLIIDADLIARELSGPGGKAESLIVKRFGAIPRTKLREIIFSDQKARKDLEAILHPLIRFESQAKIKSLISRPRSSLGPMVILYEAALLIETGHFRDFSGLIVLEAPYEERLRRMMARDGHPRELCEQILASQVSDAERRQAATHIIDNSGSLDKLKEHVRALLPLLA